MAGRRTNLALLVLVPVSVATGLTAMAYGTPISRLAVVAHGVAGIAVIILGPWKTMIAARGLRRSKPGRWLSTLLAAMAVVALITGFVQSTGAARKIGPLTTMQVHVGSGVTALVLSVAHVRMRPIRLRAADVSRRAFLRAGGLAAAGGVIYAASEGAMDLLDLPGSDRRFTGSHERGSFEPAAMPTTQWFDDRTQHIERDGFVLRIAGEAVPLDELGEPTAMVTATLDCTSGWFSTQHWAGFPVADLVGDPEDGGSLLVRSRTGYSRRFPLADIPHLLLATHVGAEPLSPGHGSPLRLVAPGRRGFWWVKWVESIQVDSRPPWWQSPFPLT